MATIALAKIRTDGGTQMRTSINTDTMLEYRDKWKSGIVFDPIDLFYDGAEYWLADGFHRFYGAREAKQKDIPATVHNGTVRDAILFACGANTSHGLRRTNPDKRLAVIALLNDDVWREWSNRVIAEKCGVSHSFVNEVKSQLESVSSCDEKPSKTRLGKDGKRRPASRSSNGKPTKPERKPEPKQAEEPKQPSAFDLFKPLWNGANQTQRILIRDYIEQNP